MIVFMANRKDLIEVLNDDHELAWQLVAFVVQNAIHSRYQILDWSFVIEIYGTVQAFSNEVVGNLEYIIQYWYSKQDDPSEFYDTETPFSEWTLKQL